MVNLTSGLDATFAALADPTRRAILARLARGETSVSNLARPFSMSLPAVLKHVDSLERAGLLAARKEGRVRRCRLDAAPLSEAAKWIAGYRQFWEARLDALDRYLQQAEDKEDTSWPTLTPKRRSRSGSRGPTRRAAKRSSGRGSTRER